MGIRSWIVQPQIWMNPDLTSGRQESLRGCSEGCELTTFWGFVGAVGAVHVQVTHEVLGDTLSVLAHELILRIAGAVGVH